MESSQCNSTFQIPHAPTMTVLENLMLVPTKQAGEQIWNPWFCRGGFHGGGKIRQSWPGAYVRGPDPPRDEYASNLSGGQKKLLSWPDFDVQSEDGLPMSRAPVNRGAYAQAGREHRAVAEFGITFVIEHDMTSILSSATVIVMSEGTKLAEARLTR
jgi:ABC-type branched-subunit amino acid transport system ATPase component